MQYHDNVAQHGNLVLVADVHGSLWIVDIETGTAKRVKLDELAEQEIARPDQTLRQ
jgi:hypothetical protein